MTRVTKCDITAARLLVTPALEIRVLTQSFEGHCFLHIREFALTADNDFVPTRRGVAIPAEFLTKTLDALRCLEGSPPQEGTLVVMALSTNREVRFGFSTWKGTTKADIRHYAAAKSQGDFVPTPKGVRFNLALIREMARAVEALVRN